MTIDQAPARAIERFGSSTNWPPHNRPPAMSLGTVFREGSWPIHRTATVARKDLGELVLWRNPDGASGDLWDITGQGIPEWRPNLKPVGGWFLREIRQYFADLQARQAANRVPLRLPWGKKWKTPGGTQGQSADNGVIIELANGDRYEIQGLARIEQGPAGALTIAGINFRAGAPVAAYGHYRCDGISLIRKGADESKVRGSQGPKSKVNGLLGPAFCREFIPNFEARLVLPNVEFGPRARAVPPGWVEHPLPGQPYANSGGVTYPEGPDPRMVPCFTGLCLVGTDADIERWLSSRWIIEGNSAHNIEDARRWYARNLRGWVTDADRPATIATRIRVSETGTGEMILESEGDLDPDTAVEWAVLGVTAANCWHLGDGLLDYLTLTVTDGLAV